MTNSGPRLAVDCIILVGGRVLLIQRRNEPVGWALPGGFVEYGESVEAAVRREMKEETGLELDQLRQFRVYSDPGGTCAGTPCRWCLPPRVSASPQPGMMLTGIVWQT
jgi:ADP-ribose pyrophosphatase YjhB (NUDIX family)